MGASVKLKAPIAHVKNGYAKLNEKMGSGVDSGLWVVRGGQYADRLARK